MTRRARRGRATLIAAKPVAPLAGPGVSWRHAAASGLGKRPDSWPSGTPARRGTWRSCAVVTGHGPSRSGSTAATSWPASVSTVKDFARDQQAMALSGPDLPVRGSWRPAPRLGRGVRVSERCFGVFLETLDAARWRPLPALLRGLDHPAGRAELAPGTAGGSAPARAGGGGAAQGRTRRPSWPAGVRLAGDPGRVSGAGQLSSPPANMQSAGCWMPARRSATCCSIATCSTATSWWPADGSRLTAVFDWACYTVGDFLYEVAWFTFWAPWHAGLAAIDFRSAVRAALPGGTAWTFPGSMSACAATNCTSASPTWPTARSPAIPAATCPRSPGGPARSSAPGDAAGSRGPGRYPSRAGSPCWALALPRPQ